MILTRKLKYIKYEFDETARTFTITTYDRETGEKNGRIVLNKTYLFSTMRSLIWAAQKLSRGYSRWIRKKYD